MLELLKAAVLPGFSLRECLSMWGDISYLLREAPRRRKPQLHFLATSGLLS